VSLVAPWVAAAEAATSIVVYAEAIEHLKGLPNSSGHVAELQTALEEILPYGLNYTILDRYADLRRNLRPPYGSGLIGIFDTLIAATALEHDLTLVTMDTDFQRVPGLRVLLIPRHVR